MEILFYPVTEHGLPLCPTLLIVQKIWIQLNNKYTGVLEDLQKVWSVYFIKTIQNCCVKLCMDITNINSWLTTDLNLQLFGYIQLSRFINSHKARLYIDFCGMAFWFNILLLIAMWALSTSSPWLKQNRCLMLGNLGKCKCMSFGTCVFPMNQYTLSLVKYSSCKSSSTIRFGSSFYLKLSSHIHHNYSTKS